VWRASSRFRYEPEEGDPRGFGGRRDRLGVLAKRIFGPAGSPTTSSSIHSTPLYLHPLSVLVDKWKLTLISGSKFAHKILLTTSAVLSS